MGWPEDQRQIIGLTKMTKVSFTIPTWNRARKLEICIESIAKQIIEFNIDAEICVSNNCSDDETDIVLSDLSEKYGFMRTKRLDEHDALALTNWNNALNMASGDFVWLFGDDDELLAGGLPAVMSVAREGKYSVISAGSGWFRPHTNQLAAGSLFNIMNTIGWNQVAGWMTGVVMRRNICQDLSSILNENPHNQSAYPHVSALLQVASGLHSAYVDAPVVQPQGQQTAEDIDRWTKGNVAWKYFLLIDSFEYLIKEKFIPEKMSPKFFRYLNYYLWDRFLSNMISGHLTGKPFPDRGWEIIENMSKMINDEGMAKNIVISASLARRLCEERQEAAERYNKTTTTLVDTLKKSGQSLFPLSSIAK